MNTHMKGSRSATEKWQQLAFGPNPIFGETKAMPRLPENVLKIQHCVTICKDDIQPTGS